MATKRHIFEVVCVTVSPRRPLSPRRDQRGEGGRVAQCFDDRAGL
jgi:hypothetical protein